MTDTQTASDRQSGAWGDPRFGIATWGYAGWLATALLILLGLIYVAYGVATLIAPNFEGDLRYRWRERSYLSAGVDPYDVSIQFGGVKPNAAEKARIAEHNLQNEPHIGAGYPPWGLAASFLFIPPGPQRLAQVVFAAISILALGLIVWQAFALGQHWGTGPGLLMAATIFAMFGNASTLHWGQYGLILNAFLLLSLWAYAKGHAIGSGLAMALAAIKPNYSALQVAVMVSRQQWVSLLAVAVVCAAASLVPWVLTGVNPIEMIQQMLRQSAYVSDFDGSLLRLARSMMPYPQAVASLGLVGLAAVLLLGWKYRHSSPLVATSVAAVIGRICLYNREYDNVMLMFPLLALGLLALTIRKPWAWIVFAIYGATLWTPIPYGAPPPLLIVALSGVWLAGLAVICWHAELVPPLKPAWDNPVRRDASRVEGQEDFACG
jgi:hypothetical protein